MSATVTLVRIDVPALLGSNSDLAPHAIDSAYVADCWASVTGPTGALLLRRAAMAWGNGDTAIVDALDLAHWCGVGRRALIETCRRLSRIGVAEWWEESSTLRIRSHLPPLTDRQLQRAGVIVRRLHTDLTTTTNKETSP